MTAVRVELDQVSKHYAGTYAVRDVSLSLKEGQSVALAGHNGAGKSTLIKLMLGLIHADAGRVNVLGSDPRIGRAPARFEIGYLPETVALHPAMTGVETLAFYARLKRQPLSDNHRLLEQVGIAQAAKKRVGTYSKGMRQRLALAQALLGSPKVLFLDEPTTGLDPALRLGFYEILRELRQTGTTILLSSHALTEIEGHSDRIIIMKNGAKVADGTMRDLRREADLPVLLRLTLDPNTDTASSLPATWTRIHDHQFEWRCAQADKIDAMRSIADLPANMVDIEVIQPSLDDMYAHFLRREEL